MFGMGMPEIIIILVIALIVIGPKKLPELAKALGKGMSEFKKATQEIKGSLNVEEDFKEAKKDLVDSVTGLDKVDVAEESGSTGEKPPKYKDFDEVIENFHKDAKPEEDVKPEEAPKLGEDDTLKDKQEMTPEKNADGQ